MHQAPQPSQGQCCQLVFSQVPRTVDGQGYWQSGVCGARAELKVWPEERTEGPIVTGREGSSGCWGEGGQQRCQAPCACSLIRSSNVGH